MRFKPGLRMLPVILGAVSFGCNAGDKPTGLGEEEGGVAGANCSNYPAGPATITVTGAVTATLDCAVFAIALADPSKIGRRKLDSPCTKVGFHRRPLS